MSAADKLALANSEEEDDEEFVDETLAERLWGLTEMFPESLRNSCSTVTNFTWNSAKFTLIFTRSAVWILASSFSILLLPVLFERDRASAQEQQLMQQRQILMGPNAAVSGQPASGPGVMGMMPPPPAIAPATPEAAPPAPSPS